MIILSILLLILGIVTAVSGLKLFRVLLPIVGFVSGIMVGFGGVQGVFGVGAVSTAVALIMAVIVGCVMALLSFLFFEIAVIILITILGASVFSYLAVAIGLGNNGFLLFMLTVAGGILGFILSTTSGISRTLVIYGTSMLGVIFILASVLLLVGTVSVDQLLNQGIVRTVLDVVDQEFIWLLVGLGGTLLAGSIQKQTATYVVFDDSYQFKEVKARS
jgi:hypothetical protein